MLDHPSTEAMFALILPVGALVTFIFAFGLYGCFMKVAGFFVLITGTLMMCLSKSTGVMVSGIILLFILSMINVLRLKVPNL